MKKGDALKLDSTWWAQNKPDALPSTGLGAALKEYEKFKLTAFPAKPADKDYKKAIAALGALLKVEAARRKGIAKCGNVLFYDTKAALQNTTALTKATKLYSDGLTKEIRWITDAAKTLPAYLQAHDRLLNDYQQAGTDPTTRGAALKQLLLNRDRIAEKIEIAKTTASWFIKGKGVLSRYPALWAKFTQAQNAFTKQVPAAQTALSEAHQAETAG